MKITKIILIFCLGLICGGAAVRQYLPPSNEPAVISYELTTVVEKPCIDPENQALLKKEAELLYHYYESQKKNENFPLAANLLSSAIAIMELADKTDTRLPAWRLESKDIQPLINSEKRLDKETGRKKSY